MLLLGKKWLFPARSLKKGFLEEKRLGCAFEGGGGSMGPAEVGTFLSWESRQASETTLAQVDEVFGLWALT